MKILPNNLGPVADLANLKRESRFADGSVHVKLEDAGYTVEATDGMKMIRVKGEYRGSAEEYPGNPAMDAMKNGSNDGLIPAVTWKKAFAAAGKVKSTKPLLRSVAIKVGENDAAMSSTDLDSTNYDYTRQVEGRFPKIDSVIPKNEPKASITLDPKQVLVAVKAMCDVLKESTDLRADFRIHDGLLYVKCNGVEVLVAACVPNTPAPKPVAEVIVGDYE